MVRDYQQHKARRLHREANAHSQNIASMFRRTNQAAAAVAAPSAEEGQDAVDAEPMVVNESAINADGGDDGSGGGGDSDSGDNGEEDDEAIATTADGNGNEQWSLFAQEWFKEVKDEISKAVNMTGRGEDRRRMGKYPDPMIRSYSLMGRK